MTLDLIIISHAKTPELKAITQRGIYTAIGNEHTIKVNPIVIEGNPNVVYDGAKTYYQSGEFNYNRFLNYGASLGDSEYICFANNDLVYGEDWAETMVGAMVGYQLDSVSPYSAISHQKHNTGILPNTGLNYGYTVKHQFEGWCFIWKRELWNEIKLDERVKFWCSDDATVLQLESAKCQHALVTYAFVEHPHNGGHTLKTALNRYELTIEQAKIFNRLYDKNIENVGK